MVAITEIRNTERELRAFRARVLVAIAFVLAAFGALGTRLVWLQLVQYEYYRTRAEDNRIAIVPLPPHRGLILDRNGLVLARNYSAYTLEIAPGKVDDLERTIEALSTLVEIGPRDRSRFGKHVAEARNAESLPIRTRLSDEEVARVAVNRYRFPGVEIKEIGRASCRERV